MSEHFCVAADDAHIRFFRHRQDAGQREPDFEQVQGLDFPAGRQNYTERDSDVAGRFQSSKHPSAASGAPGGGAAGRTGMSIDERMPMQREEERRRARDVANEIEIFFAGRKDFTWDLAIAPAMHHEVVDQLSPKVRTQLQQVMAKDLVNQRPEDVRAHFVGGGR